MQAVGVLYPSGVTIRGLVLLLLVGAMVAVVPLAHATPPDPTWFGGFFDNADYDDAVVMVVSGVAAIESLTLREGGPLAVVVAPAPSSDESLRLLAQASSSPPRAPPVA
jgi:hypothetical protein